MGQRASTYSYESSTVQSAYGSYVSGGISLWGTNIAMSYTSSVPNAVGVFGVTDAAVNYNAATLVTSVNSSTGYRTGYTITISSQNFNSSSKTTAGKYRTIAHEIGHAYGLGHVPSSSNIMYSYYSATKNVTSQDIWGMKVVTHIHQHSSSTTGTYSEYSVDSHKVLCSSCGGIYIRAHTFSSGVCTKCGYTQ